MEIETINTWAIKIAEVATPDEVDLAPIMIQAFLNGGKDRQDLFRQSQGDVVGGFGASDFQAVFPWIIQGIATAAPFINAIVTSDVVGKYLSAIKDLLTIRDGLARKKQAEALPEDPYAPLKKVIAILSKDLAKVKISQEQRDLITYHVIQELLKDQNSVKFVKKVAGGS